MVKSFSPPEGIFAFATIAAAVCTREAGCFSPPEGIFAFATVTHKSTGSSNSASSFSPPEGIFAFATVFESAMDQLMKISFQSP